MRGRKSKVIIIPLLSCIIIFVVIPFVISIAYGNFPFFNNDYLSKYDIIITNDKKISDSNLSFINYNTYTWSEIKTYIIKKQMTYKHILRDITVLLITVIVAVCIDRTIGSNLPRPFRRK